METNFENFEYNVVLYKNDYFERSKIEQEYDNLVSLLYRDKLPDEELTDEESNQLEAIEEKLKSNYITDSTFNSLELAIRRQKDYFNELITSEINNKLNHLKDEKYIPSGSTCYISIIELDVDIKPYMSNIPYISVIAKADDDDDYDICIYVEGILDRYNGKTITPVKYNYLKIWNPDFNDYEYHLFLNEVKQDYTVFESNLDDWYYKESKDYNQVIHVSDNDKSIFDLFSKIKNIFK